MSDDHLSLDELAELDEGLLPGERLSAVQAHLHGCEQCRRRAEAISSTRRMLAALPLVTMPADVSARIDQTLAAAATGPAAPRVDAAHDTDTDTASSLVGPSLDQSETIVPNVTEIRRSRFEFGRPTMAAAAVVVVVAMAVTAVVVGYHRRSTSSGEAGSAATFGSAAAPPIISSDQQRNLVKSSTGQTYTLNNLDSLVPGLVGSPAGNPASNTPSTGNEAHGPTSTNGRTPAAGHSLDNQAEATAIQPLADSTSKLLGCAARLTTVPNAVPLAVDFGYWTNGAIHKAPAAVFVFKGADPSKLEVYVTNATCSGNGLIRTVRTVPLP